MGQFGCELEPSQCSSAHSGPSVTGVPGGPGKVRAAVNQSSRGGTGSLGLCVGTSVAECPMPVLPGWYLGHHPFLKAVDSLAVMRDSLGHALKCLLGLAQS